MTVVLKSQDVNLAPLFPIGNFINFCTAKISPHLLVKTAIWNKPGSPELFHPSRAIVKLHTSGLFYRFSFFPFLLWGFGKLLALLFSEHIEYEIVLLLQYGVFCNIWPKFSIFIKPIVCWLYVTLFHVHVRTHHA